LEIQGGAARVALRDSIARITKIVYQAVPAVERFVWVPGVIAPFAGEGFATPDMPSKMHGLITAHDGRLVHKWPHYLDIYDRHFAPFLDMETVRILEIGVSHGGFLEILRKYFGDKAVLFGVDINPQCAVTDGNGISIRIGSQADPSFLNSVVDEMGGVDIVIDDGSHIAYHQKASLEILFPRLSIGGIYFAEDLHTAYWPGLFRGGFRRKGTFIEICKSLVDHVHRWYHPHKVRERWKDNIKAIHFYDSIVVIDKGIVARPYHAKIGKPSF
jgi:hypothetical protein